MNQGERFLSSLRVLDKPSQKAMHFLPARPRWEKIIEPPKLKHLTMGH